MTDISEKLNVVNPMGHNTDQRIINLVVNLNEVVFRLQEKISSLEAEIEDHETRITALE